jgi:AraC-like DNA-binding protein
MRPQFLKVQSQPLGSFSVRKDTLPNVNNRWHYHQEVELLQIHAGSGMQFIGDSIRPFEPGDIILVGAHLPHYWRFDEISTRQNITYATVIHFHENLWGDHFINLPEAHAIKSVLENSKRGILIRGKDGRKVGQLIEHMHRCQGLNRLIALLEALYAFHAAPSQTILCSSGFKYSYSKTEDERIHNVYEYTFRHATDKIELRDVASVAGLVENSFCRYFKMRTGKTYSQFLTEVRIGQACKLLMEDKLSIKEICFASGYNNFSCFFNKFKNVTGKTPLQYKHAIEA